jgi:hypothetical protein
LALPDHQAKLETVDKEGEGRVRKFLVLVSSKCSGRRFSTLGLMTLGLPFQTLQMRFSLLPAKKAYDEDSEWTSP